MTTRAQIIAVAQAEIGYKEGTNNDTKYGNWYGLPHQPWCAMFVSWCAAHARGADLFSKFAYVPSGVAWFKQRGQWQGRGYLPQGGDLVFFGSSDHVGLVEKVTNGVLYSIEGNTSSNGNTSEGDGVYRRSRALNNSWIMGYGLPAYEEDEMSYDQFKQYMDQYLVEQGKLPPSEWSAEARAWAEQSGLITGNQDGEKKYRQFCTREQLVVMMKRLRDMVK